MARVPSYGALKVATDPLARVPVQGLPESAFGVQVGQSLAQLGQTGMQAAQRLDAIAEEHDRAAVKQLMLERTAFTTTSLYDAENGLFFQNGKNALDQAPTLRTSLQDNRKAIEAKAANPRQQRMLAELLATNDQKISADMAEYLARQSEVYRDQVSLGTVESLTDQAQRAYLAGDQKTAVDALQSALNEQLDFSIRKGQPPEYRAAQALEMRSKVWSGIAAGLLDLDKPEEAQRILDEHAGEMLVKDRTALQGRVKDARDTLDALTVVDDVVVSGVAGDDSRPPAESSPPTPAMGVNQVADTIRAEARAAGASAAEVEAMVRDGVIESTLRPTATNGSSKGLFQFNTSRGPKGERSTWDRFGSGDIFNVRDQVKAKLKLDRHNREVARRALGREPTAAELYIIHQQGEGAGPALLRAPATQGAVAALEGAGLSRARALAHIKNNLPASMRDRAASITAAEFVGLWERKWNGATVSSGRALASAPISTMTPNVLPERETFIAQVVARAGDDPGRKALFRAAAERKYSDMKAQATERQNRAWDDAQDYIQRGVPFDQWPAAVRGNISPQHKTDILKAEAAALDEASKPKTDMARYAALIEEAQTNPQRFVSRPLTDFLTGLSPEDGQEMLKLRGEIRKQGRVKPENAWSTEAAWGVADDIFASAGYNVSSGKKRDIEEIAGFKGALRKYLDAEVQRAGKRPDEARVMELARQLLLPGWRTENGKRIPARKWEAVMRGQPFSWNAESGFASQMRRANPKATDEDIARAYQFGVMTGRIPVPGG